MVPIKCAAYFNEIMVKLDFGAEAMLGVYGTVVLRVIVIMNLIV